MIDIFSLCISIKTNFILTVPVVLSLGIVGKVFSSWVKSVDAIHKAIKPPASNVY
jgi:hypothetical protein